MDEISENHFPYVVGHISRTGDRTRFITEDAASRFIGEVLILVDPEGVNQGDYYIDGPTCAECGEGGEVVSRYDMSHKHPKCMDGLGSGDGNK